LSVSPFLKDGKDGAADGFAVEFKRLSEEDVRAEAHSPPN